MPRTARGDLGDGVFHVTTRGNARAQIFRDDVDRRTFLGLLDWVVDQHGWRLFAYCLMPNHVHLVVETTGRSLSLGMRDLNGGYSRRFNQRYGRTGHVFQGRFGAKRVESERYAEELCRYVLDNPVRAGLCEEVEQYPWSALLVDP